MRRLILRLSVTIIPMVFLSLHAEDISGIESWIEKNNRNDFQKVEKSSSFSPAQKSFAAATENSLDPNRYFIGGGDQFYIAVVGDPSIHYLADINQDGDLYIPALGLKHLGRISLSEAKKQIGSFIQLKLKQRNSIYVTLTRVKEVTITVNGAVASAGTYTLPGSFRILDALRIANGYAMPSLNDCDFRQVECVNRDSVSTLDLFGYLLQNDISCNPYLYPGDNITLRYSSSRIFLNAQTKSVVGGWIPIQDGENLEHLLSLFVFDGSADTSIVYIQTGTDSNNQTERMIARKDAGAYSLGDRQIITIPQKKNYRPILMVEIFGEVARPGIYAISKEHTSAEDIVAAAGGYTSLADVNRAVIVRRSKSMEKVGKKSQQPALVSEQAFEAAVRPELYAGLKKMTTLEDYTVIELRKHSHDISLLPEDRIVVPRQDIFVYISGDVKRPGAYPYISGKSYHYYIGLAGGVTGKADRANMFGIRHFENASQMTDLSEVQAGDIIVVPDSEQAKLLSTVILPIFQSIVTTLSVALAIFSLTRN
jgi:protein involved in polysaccharide export with SLBB domain